MAKLKISSSLIRRIRQALHEDIGTGDITTNLIVPPDFKIRAKLIAKESAIVCGLVLLSRIFSRSKVRLLKKEGARVRAGETVAEISGSAREILTSERVAINFVARLSGIATLTQEFVKRIQGTRCRLLATRKTTPLWRDLEKYAVETGGGEAHRQGLFDQYMLKDNHKEVMKLMGHVGAGLVPARGRPQGSPVQKRKKNIPFIVEVDSLREIPWAMSFRPDMILLDNFTLPALRKAVRFVRELSDVGAGLVPARGRPQGSPLLEASGGISLENVGRIARTGVDRISVGKITHSPRSIDFSLEVTAPQALSSRA